MRWWQASTLGYIKKMLLRKCCYGLASVAQAIHTSSQSTHIWCYYPPRLMRLEHILLNTILTIENFCAAIRYYRLLSFGTSTVPNCVSVYPLCVECYQVSEREWRASVCEFEWWLVVNATVGAWSTYTGNPSSQTKKVISTSSKCPSIFNIIDGIVVSLLAMRPKKGFYTRFRR